MLSRAKVRVTFKMSLESKHEKLRGYAPFQTQSMTFEGDNVARQRLQYDHIITRPVLSLRQILALQDEKFFNADQKNLCVQMESVKDDIRDLKWSLLLYQVTLGRDEEQDHSAEILVVKQQVEALSREYDQLQAYQEKLQKKKQTNHIFAILFFLTVFLCLGLFNLFWS